VTGTTGRTHWAFDTINNEEEIFLYFCNPFIGANNYAESLKEGTVGYKITREGSGEGDNANIVFILEKA
jgi:hypothetical protein